MHLMTLLRIMMLTGQIQKSEWTKQVMPKSQDLGRSVEITQIWIFNMEFTIIFKKSCTYITFMSAVIRSIYIPPEMLTNRSQELEWVNQHSRPTISQDMQMQLGSWPMRSFYTNRVKGGRSIEETAKYHRIPFDKVVNRLLQSEWGHDVA